MMPVGREEEERKGGRGREEGRGGEGGGRRKGEGERDERTLLHKYPQPTNAQSL